MKNGGYTDAKEWGKKITKPSPEKNVKVLEEGRDFLIPLIPTSFAGEEVYQFSMGGPIFFLPKKMVDDYLKKKKKKTTKPKW